MVHDDSFDYVTTWQLVAMIVCVAYAEVLGGYCEGGYCDSVEAGSDSNSNGSDGIRNDRNIDDGGNNSLGDNGDGDVDFLFYGDNINTVTVQNTQHTQSSRNTQTSRNDVLNASDSLYLSLLTDYYETLQYVLDVLTVRVRYTRSTYTSEYVSSLASVQQRVSHLENNPKMNYLLESKSVQSEKIRNLKAVISDLFLGVASFARDSGRQRFTYFTDFSNFSDFNFFCILLEFFIINFILFFVQALFMTHDFLYLFHFLILLGTSLIYLCASLTYFFVQQFFSLRTTRIEGSALMQTNGKVSLLLIVIFSNPFTLHFCLFACFLVTFIGLPL